ncbi:hypothetical protein [Adhaeribacter radiodurans]|uniref:Uncharacterized protein n=1 Tax=Adhaeribacter radiodurans TaxID=2745197 RepID=A0A7L7L423_9BACT|nr:hypothetical protein [Adhaeribacter radiodurans]QMU27523.1 hypothetical protein HUW48_05485 [Adhaeribacter radiodurans]
MNEKLNSLQYAILSEIERFHRETHPFLKDQMLDLKVKTREFTGVGWYVNFDPKGQKRQNNKIPKAKTYLSVSKNYYIDTLEFPISFELNLSEEGVLEFLEIVSNDNKTWNGEFNSLTIVEE